MSVRCNLGYSMREAEREFFNACDGTHAMHLIEVFDRDGQDVTRQIMEFDDAGELWLCDEDGLNYIVARDWAYEPRETVGFDRAELAEMREEGG